jgi:hypothetical protein
VSEASPATGAEANATAGGAAEAGKARRSKAGRRNREATGPTDVGLEHGRWRALVWAVIGLALGVLLIAKLGSVGKAIGVIMCIASLIPTRAFVFTLLNAPGRIKVDDDAVTLPSGLCRAKSVTLPFAKIRHAYFLRRAVPWTRTGPLLIVETSEGLFQYPRDWFASDSDQRRVAAALNRRLGRA